MKKAILIILVFIGLLLMAASPLVADIAIDWWAIGPGSSILSNAGTELHGMIGQGIAGQVSQSGTDLCSGYLCYSPGTIGMTYLPLIIKVP